MRVRKKPVEVEAMRVGWETWDAVCDFAGVGPNHDQPHGVFLDAENRVSETGTDRMGLLIPTLEGEMLAPQGWWVIKGVQGELYPCRDDIFRATYEPVGGTPLHHGESGDDL